MIAVALHFTGQCEQAIDLYTRAFHATDVFKDYYRDAPDDSGMEKSERTKDWIMHSGMTIYGSLINLSDGPEPIVDGNRYKLNVFTDTLDQVRHAYDTLAPTGEVVVPLGPQFFSPLYAAVKDEFGVLWQIIGPGQN